MSDDGQWCDPGYCQLAEVSNYAKELKEKLAIAVEALRSTLNFIENTEGEMGVILGCGDKARAALAEIKSGVATTPYGLEGENHE